jgi:hypothetical protein
VDISEGFRRVETIAIVSGGGDDNLWQVEIDRSSAGNSGRKVYTKGFLGRRIRKPDQPFIETYPYWFVG